MRFFSESKASRIFLAGGSALERQAVENIAIDAGHDALTDMEILTNGGAEISEADAVENDISLVVFLETPGDAQKEIQQEILTLLPKVPVVVFSADAALIKGMRAKGMNVSGIVDPSLDLDRIPHILQLALDGLCVLPSSFFSEPAEKETPKAALPSAFESTVEDASLTPRELDVAALISFGKSNKEIARQLKIAVNTVNVHVNSLMRKLYVENRTKIAIWFLTVGKQKVPAAQLSSLEEVGAQDPAGLPQRATTA